MRDALRNGGDIIYLPGKKVSLRGRDNGLKPGRYICLAVADNGEGMDEETLRKQPSLSLRQRALGKEPALVSMVHGFAEQSGGTLALQSQKDKGTTAEIWLPVAEVSTETVAPTRFAQPTVATIHPALAILAVDDDPLVLMNTVAMLEDLGHTVFEAYSGKEALEILRQEDSIQLVITDQAMPQISGRQLAEAIKLEWPHLIVLLATGYVDRIPGER